MGRRGRGGGRGRRTAGWAGGRGSVAPTAAGEERRCGHPRDQGCKQALSPCPQRSETAARAAASRTTMWITPSSPIGPHRTPPRRSMPDSTRPRNPLDTPSETARSGPRRRPRVTNRTPGTARRPLTCDDQILTFGLRHPACVVRRTGHRIPTSSSYTSVSRPHVVPRSLRVIHVSSTGFPQARAQVRPDPGGGAGEASTRHTARERAGQESTDHALPVLSPHRLPGHRQPHGRRRHGDPPAPPVPGSAAAASPRWSRRAST